MALKTGFQCSPPEHEQKTVSNSLELNAGSVVYEKYSWRRFFRNKILRGAKKSEEVRSYTRALEFLCHSIYKPRSMAKNKSDEEINVSFKTPSRANGIVGIAWFLLAGVSLILFVPKY